MSTIGALHKFQSRLTERFTYAAMEIYKEVEHIVRGYQEENQRLRFLLHNMRNSSNIDNNRVSISATAVKEQPPKMDSPMKIPEPLTKTPQLGHNTFETFANIPEDEPTEESKPLANILKEELTEIPVSPAKVFQSLAYISDEQQIEYDGNLAAEVESEDNCITEECLQSEANDEVTTSLRDMAFGNFNTPKEDQGPLQPPKNSYKKRSTREDKPKRKNVMTTIALKKELIAKWERGTRVSDLAVQYNMAKSTISTILKRKEAIKAADVAKGVKTLSSRRSDKVEEVEKVLLEWITHKQLRGDTVSETLICDKARELHNALTRDNPGGSADEFKASKGWFCKFKKRSGIHGVLRPGEAARAEKESNHRFEDEFEDLVDNHGFLS
ncbi:uncharacterized protein LOC133636948 [Entelurus aequoreus]|uniref:uncharacterized protein LOC133636948 n=1 Tax=Entelurus aequoreus TaxID=161455 RepID=UPI002B1E172D|nr:uncharacterized protein LOC133636948 [Entelurus aequoreus]